MNMDLRDEIFKQAQEWIREAGENIRSNINNPLVIDTKSNPNDLVTAMDRETESYFVRKIKETYPGHSIVGEEGYGDKLTSMDGTVWIIDPIDGTMNFVHQKRNFAISVGVFQDGVGEIGFIYDVMADILYHAKRNEGAYKDDVKLPPLKAEIKFKEVIMGMNHYWLCPNRIVDEKVMQNFVRTIRGTRTYGSAALEFAYVAEGIINGYISMGLSPWDIAAGMVILKEVGGVTSNIDGNPINMLERNSILACNANLQKEILAFVREGRKE